MKTYLYNSRGYMQNLDTLATCPVVLEKVVSLDCHPLCRLRRIVSLRS